MKISFDFDSTLSTKKIQSFLSVFDRGRVEVFIITSRSKDVNNDDLYVIAESFDISIWFEDSFLTLKSK